MGLKVNKVIKLYRGRGFLQGSAALLREIYGVILKTLFNRQFVSRKIYQYEMILDLYDKGISRTLWLFGQRELDHKWILEKTLKPGNKMLDIGSNIGYYALMESELVGVSGELIAIEPSPENVDLLKRNLLLNSVTNVTVIQGAVSNFDGHDTFWLAAESNLNTFHKAFLEEKSGAVKQIEVAVSSIRHLVEEHGEIDFVRMDIEGHEVEVLGDLATLAEESDLRPAVIFETHTRAYTDQHDIAPVLRRLFAAGYSAKYVASSTKTGTKILEAKGLPAIHKVRTDDVIRSIHQEVPESVLLSCLTDTGGIRTVFLAAT
jgi:FkbM family methyltransferase